jgi:single-strand DNA-binding protein
VTGRLDQRSWETQDGERRSKVEITADEIAPSLRWATVQVTKNERRSPEGPSGPNGDSHATTEQAYQPRPAAEPAPVSYGSGHEDEEPF